MSTFESRAISRAQPNVGKDLCLGSWPTMTIFNQRNRGSIIEMLVWDLYLRHTHFYEQSNFYANVWNYQLAKLRERTLVRLVKH